MQSTVLNAIIIITIIISRGGDGGGGCGGGVETVVACMWRVEFVGRQWR